MLSCVGGEHSDARQCPMLAPAAHGEQREHVTAMTSEIAASHVAFISHPDVVARLIEQAATATAK
jgi:hypothetical protein